jgi:hypothetical protein
MLKGTKGLQVVGKQSHNAKKTINDLYKRIMWLAVLSFALILDLNDKLWKNLKSNLL